MMAGHPLSGFAIRTWNSRRRLAVVTFLLILAAVAVLYAAMQTITTSTRRAMAINFDVSYIRPEVAALCPGETLRYHVHVTVDAVPATSRVAETFCRTGIDGVCSTSLARTYWLPLLDVRHIESDASRVIPDSPFFTPGDYELWHASTDTNADETVGYRVPFTIRDDCNRSKP